MGTGARYSEVMESDNTKWSQIIPSVCSNVL